MRPIVSGMNRNVISGSRGAIYRNQIVGPRETRSAAPARSISAMAFTRPETLLSGLRQTHLGAANPGRWRNPRQRAAAAELSNGKVQLHSNGLGAAHG